MDNERIEMTALPIDHRPEVHQRGSAPGGTSPISLDLDKDIREGNLPADRFDDYRMRELPTHDHPAYGEAPPVTLEREQEVR